MSSPGLNIKENWLNLSFSWAWTGWFCRNIRAVLPMVLSDAQVPLWVYLFLSYSPTGPFFTLVIEHSTPAVICHIACGGPSARRVNLPSSSLPILHPADRSYWLPSCEFQELSAYAAPWGPASFGLSQHHSGLNMLVKWDRVYARAQYTSQAGSWHNRAGFSVMTLVNHLPRVVHQQFAPECVCHHPSCPRLSAACPAHSSSRQRWEHSCYLYVTESWGGRS